MAELINLNKARKAKVKQRETAQAAQNRLIHGISTHDRKLEKARQKLETGKIDGKLLKTESDNKKG